MSFQVNFLNKVKPHAFTVYKTIGILPSVTAAQAALESNWGRSSLSTQANNFFGIKGGAGVPSVNFMTKEFINGRMVTVSEPFQKFSSFEDCIINGYMKRVIGRDRYKKARGVKDAKTQITIIWQAGYATDPAYVSKIMSTVKSNGLDKWDKEAIAGGDGGNAHFGGTGGTGTGVVLPELEGEQFYTFNNNFIKKNNYTRPGFKLAGVAGIVLHDAGTPGLAVNTIRSSLDKGNGGRRNGYHILIGKTDTVGLVPLDEGVYHTNPKELEIDFLKKSASYHPNGNADLTTISIGLCSESNGTFSDAMVARAIAVCSELINHYALPSEIILRGFDVDKSLEPLQFYNNYFDYTTFLGLVNYQRNQDTPLMNEDLQALYAQRDAGGTGGATDASSGELINAVSGTRQKLLQLAFEMEGWGMSYSQARRYQIFKNGYADCSSFTQYLYKKVANIDPGITTKFQIRSGKQVSRANARPGDLVFWCPPGRSPSVPSNVSHMGMVIDKGGNYCIHTSYSAGPGRTVQRIAISSIRGLTLMQFRTYLKEDGEATDSSKVETPVKNGSISDIDLSKRYVINVKSSINTYNTDSDTGTTVKRLSKGSVMNVLSVGAYGYRVGEFEWVLKKDATSYEMREKGSSKDPVGTAIVLGMAPAKSAPSISSPNVLDQGKAKFYQPQSTLPVYGERNSMLLVSPVDKPSVYIPKVSTNYESNLGKLPLYTDKETNKEPAAPPVTNTIKVKAKFISSAIDPVSGHIIAPGSISVSSRRFAMGSDVEIRIPSFPSYNGIYHVASYHEDDSDIVYIYTYQNSDIVTLGTRNGTGQTKR